MDNPVTSTKADILLRAAQKWHAFANTAEDKLSRARWGCTDLSNANSAVWEACRELHLSLEQIDKLVGCQNPGQRLLDFLGEKKHLATYRMAGWNL